MSEDVVCRGSWALGNNCGLCSRCIETRPSPPPLMSISLACNDRNGNEMTEFSAVNVETSDLMEFEGSPITFRFCPDDERLRFKGQYKAAPHMLKVYGRGRVPVWKRTRWVGNIHWDMIGAPVPHGVAFLRWLSLAGWSMNSGPTRVFDLWRRLDPLDIVSDEWQSEMGKAMGVQP